MVKVKICGLTNLEDASTAARLGADYLGFILYPKSPRYVPPERAAEILKELPPSVKKVAVVVNADTRFLKELLKLGFDLLQLHGNESPGILKEIPPERVIKVFRVSAEAPPREELKRWEDVYAFLLDTYKKDTFGGTGETFNWEVAKTLVSEGWRIFLAGGLNPENVAEAVRCVKPFAVDVSSGVELSKGKKDLKKLEEFIKRAKSVSV
jgi:phosphoribosylanthranilate isomerase